MLRTLGKILRKPLTNFEKVLEYKKMLIDLKNFKEAHWQFQKDTEKF